MKIIKSDYNNIKNNEKIAIAIGNFDGVHLGHSYILNKLVSENKNSGLMTFTPDPDYLFNKEFKHITNNEAKLELVNKFNVKNILLINFDMKLAGLSKDEFINFLKEINVYKIYVGQDFKFGKKRSGSVKDLQDNFDVSVIGDYIVNGIKVSSTYIKQLISEGKIEEAKIFLGHDFYITSNVIHGNKIGRTINYPTANIDQTGYIEPKVGVYLGNMIIWDKTYNCMISVGYNPTLNKSNTIKIEAHILDFNKDIYGKKVKLVFLKRIRDEIKFNSKEDLIKQLDNDKKVAYKYFKGE